MGEGRCTRNALLRRYVRYFQRQSARRLSWFIVRLPPGQTYNMHQHLGKSLKVGLYLLFLMGLAAGCYRHPVPDEFDRYMYEAIVRGKSQPLEVVYQEIRHENKRTEESSNLESPELLREFEPLWAVRPLYIDTVWLLSYFVPIQSAISLISAASLFGIGIIVFCWTDKPVQSALLMAFYPVLLLARFGTPDALSALLTILALWLISERMQISLAVAVLFLSLGIRTDNLLLLLAVLGLLAWEKKIRVSRAALLAAVAIGVVLAINHWASNYGWAVLFRLSLIGGRHPAQMPHAISLREYVTALLRGIATIFPRVAIWILLGLTAWVRNSLRPILTVLGIAATAHFLLYPSGDDRYLTWAYIVAAVAFIRSFGGRRGSLGAEILDPDCAGMAV